MQENQEQDKNAGKVEPIKLTKEELDRRKETGYTEEESKKSPGGKGGQASKQGAEEVSSDQKEL